MKYTIYSIVCKDGSTDYTYIDYTRNLSNIKYHHKQNLLHHIGTLYDNIREFGGWANWEMNTLETCDDIYVAKTIVQRYQSGLSNTNENSKSIIYHCETCNYECNKKSEFDRHTSSIKHKRLTSTTSENNDLTELSNYMKEIVKSNQELVKSNQEIVKCNQELQQQVVELSTKQPVQQITNVVQNTQNNSFNIQVFLNEQCGEAFNLSDVLKSMVITNEDLVYNTQVGFVKGMTAIFKREMCDKIPLVKRPVHCTDLKRETVFYRENNVWHKEEGKTVEEDIMFQLTRSCLRTFMEWRKVHPDAENMRSEFNTLCDKIQVSVMPGYEKDKLYPKTMTEIYKHCLIDKKNMR
jgi:hypothetical protein